MAAREKTTVTAGGAIFGRLKALGVDYVFCNSGTDFPPIIEGLAEAAAKDIDLPQAVVIPHEHLAMGMAHGYYQATGRAPGGDAAHQCGSGQWRHRCDQCGL